jgi:hypothetical protein
VQSGQLQRGPDLALVIDSDYRLTAAALRSLDGRLGNMRPVCQLLDGPAEPGTSLPDLSSRQHQSDQPKTWPTKTAPATDSTISPPEVSKVMGIVLPDDLGVSKTTETQLRPSQSVYFTLGRGP